MTGILRSLFFDNFMLKVVSIAASIFLFSLVHGAEDAQKSMFVDVISTLPNAGSGKMLISEIPVRVRVTIVGSPTQLNAIRPGDVPPLELDLRDTRRTSYEIDPTDLDLPLGVSVQSVEPSSIPLEWVERRERRVRVRPILVGQPRAGRMLAEPVRIEPEQVTLIGPRSEMEGLNRIDTVEIDVSALPDGRTERRVRLARLPEHVMAEGDSSVTVTMEILPERSERAFARVAVGAVGVSARSIRPSVVTVVLSGPPSVVQGIEAEQLLPFVDGTPLRGERTPQMVRVQVNGVPEGVEVVRVAPREVLLTPG